jgi:hypothetical protein
MEYKNLIEEINNRTGVVTNTDIDGVLSAALLCRLFPHLNIVGFTNSDNNIFLSENFKKETLIYLDIFMCDKDVLSIDNHIVDSKLYPIDNPLKINPNLFHNVYYENYTDKYPFSTFIFLLSLFNTNMFELDIDVEIGKTAKGEVVFLWELLLRADDTLLNTYKFKRNTSNWWPRLLNNSNNPLLHSLYNKVCEVKDINNALAIKEKVQRFLLETFSIKKDGFKNMEDFNFEDFFKFFSSLMGYKSPLPKLDKKYFLKSEKKHVSELEGLKTKYNIKTLAIIDKNTVSFSYIDKNSLK